MKLREIQEGKNYNCGRKRNESKREGRFGDTY